MRVSRKCNFVIATTITLTHWVSAQMERISSLQTTLGSIFGISKTTTKLTIWWILSLQKLKRSPKWSPTWSTIRDDLTSSFSRQVKGMYAIVISVWALNLKMQLLSSNSKKTPHGNISLRTSSTQFPRPSSPQHLTTTSSPATIWPYRSGMFATTSNLCRPWMSQNTLTVSFVNYMRVREFSTSSIYRSHQIRGRYWLAVITHTLMWSTYTGKSTPQSTSNLWTREESTSESSENIIRRSL